MKHKITVYRGRFSWMTRHTDPEVKKLFGTDEIPTMYQITMSDEKVLAELRRLNPDRLVSLGIRES